MRQTQSGIFDENKRTALSFWSLIFLVGGSLCGVAAALLLLPGWLPGLDRSMEGNSPQVFWFLSRSSAGIAYILLWLSMVAGLSITNKLARIWPGGPKAVDLHQYLSLLGLTFALFHGGILIGDRYIHFSLLTVLIPFSSHEYRPFWVGLGQLSTYLLGLVAFSFYIRRRITYRVWRMIHYLSFVVFGLALLHGIQSGTNSSQVWVNRFYWFSAGTLIFLSFYRLVTPLLKPFTKTASALE